MSILICIYQLKNNPNSFKDWVDLVDEVKRGTKLVDDQAQLTFDLLLKQIEQAAGNLKKKPFFINILSTLIDKDKCFEKYLEKNHFPPANLFRSLALHELFTSGEEKATSAGFNLARVCLRFGQVLQDWEALFLDSHQVPAGVGQQLNTLAQEAALGDQESVSDRVNRLAKKSIVENLAEKALPNEIQLVSERSFYADRKKKEDFEEFLNFINTINDFDYQKQSIDSAYQEDSIMCKITESLKIAQEGRNASEKEEARELSHSHLKNLIEYHKRDQNEKLKEFEKRKAKLSETGDILSYIEDQEKTLTKISSMYQDACSLTTPEMAFNLSKIHHQFINIFNSEISMCFVGLLKSGKSSMINSILCERISPSPIEVMTSIPVRYVHIPSKDSIYLSIPFYDKLNNAVEKIREIWYDASDHRKTMVSNFTASLQQFYQTVVSNDFPRFQVIQEFAIEGSNEREKYLSKMLQKTRVNEVSSQVHQLFRLCAIEQSGEQVFSEAFECLPREWNSRLDYLMTVFMYYEGFSDTKVAKFSIIDTPGIDEANIKKLNLEQTLIDIVGICHVVCLVVSPTNFMAEALERTRSYLGRVKRDFDVPVIVVSSRKDTLDENAIENLSKTIPSSLNLGEKGKDRAFVTSPEYDLICFQMIRYINITNEKPRIDGSVFEKWLASQWTFYFADGITSSSKKTSYQRSSLSEIVATSKENQEESNMEEPKKKVKQIATEYSFEICVRVAARRAIENVKDILIIEKERLEEVSKKELKIAKAKKCISAISKASQGIEEAIQSFDSKFGSDFPKIKSEVKKISSQIFGLEEPGPGMIEIQKKMKLETFEQFQKLQTKKSLDFNSPQDAVQMLRSILSCIVSGLLVYIQKLAKDIIQEISWSVERIASVVGENIQTVYEEISFFKFEVFDKEKVLNKFVKSPNSLVTETKDLQQSIQTNIDKLVESLQSPGGLVTWIFKFFSTSVRIGEKELHPLVDHLLENVMLQFFRNSQQSLSFPARQISDSLDQQKRVLETSVSVLSAKMTSKNNEEIRSQMSLIDRSVDDLLEISRSSFLLVSVNK